MKIEVIQVSSEGKNEFEIKYDGKFMYKAKLPFVSINNNKVGSIKILDKNDNEVYKEDNNFVKSDKTEIVSSDILNGSIFKVLKFFSNKDEIKIYIEEKNKFDYYVIKLNDRKYFCYSIEDGYVRHFPIYYEDKQIGEALKSNVIIDGKDEYCCYLKKDYEYVMDAIMIFLLYLDMNEYNSSDIINKSYYLKKKYTYDKNNRYYDKNWVKDNFGSEYFDKIEKDIVLVKEKIKHPIKTTKEQYNSLSSKNKKLLKLVIFLPWILMIIVLIIIISKNI